MNLEEIQDPSFLKELKRKELNELALDIRKFLVKNVSKTGGHLSSNLGVVELTIAMHKVFSEENDKLIFDVGHQSYTHKILTGRAKEFESLRSIGGLSGYINYSESKYDCWESGHSSTSISALEGFLVAKKNGADIGSCVALIGDSAIASGVAFEALNNLGSQKGLAPIIILNDNKMGISKSVGSLNKKLGSLRLNKFLRGIKRAVRKITIPPLRNLYHKFSRSIKSLLQMDNIFETLGYDYFGPFDGNDISEVTKILKRVKKLNKPCVVHVITTKGKGYEFSELDKDGKYHNVAPFNIKTGLPVVERLENEHTYTEVVLDTLYKIRSERSFTILDPAMMLGHDIKKFHETYPDSVIDVGISEEHAASFGAAMTLNGQKSVLLYYSTFLQRAYDEILNDICRPNIPVIIGIDRAGVVAGDGSTHQGIYDLSMLNGMPNIKVCMGKDLKETKALIKYAFSLDTPIAIRYPKATDFMDLGYEPAEIIDCSWEIVHQGNLGICITYGPDVQRIKKLIIENDLSITLVNARFIKPMDLDMLNKLFDMNLPIFTYEQVTESGSISAKIAQYAQKISKNISLKSIYISEDTIIEHGSVEELLEKYHLSDKDILKGLRNLYEN